MRITGTREPRDGMTLIELLIALAIMGIMASVVTLLMRRNGAPVVQDPARIVADSVAAVVARGWPAAIRLTIGGRVVVASVHPDGTVIADSAFHIDRLTARTIDAR